MSEKNNHDEKEEKLHGAFTSVMMLGVFIIVAWLSVYSLYLSR